MLYERLEAERHKWMVRGAIRMAMILWQCKRLTDQEVADFLEQWKLGFDEYERRAKIAEAVPA